MLISSAMLERHIDCLAKQFEFLSLDEIGRHLESATPFPRPAAAITFDDGYSDVYHHAYPILKRKGIPAAVFVVTGLAGTRRIPLHDRLYLVLSRAGERRGLLPKMMTQALPGESKRGALKNVNLDSAPSVMAYLLGRFSHDEIERIVGKLQTRVRIESEVIREMAPLSWSMIQEMHRNGIAIGSHTRSHALLTQEHIMRAKSELTESRHELEVRLDSPVEHFAYPDGRFNPSVVEAVCEAGYRYGFGICQTRDPRFPTLTIPRKILWEHACLNAMGRFSPAVMECQTHWAFDYRERCDHVHEKVDSDLPASSRIDRAVPAPAQREM
jgi:peptidoglycan/xylan/chitin deacetylase (PgdA/CDA1 family)